MMGPPGGLTIAVTGHRPNRIRIRPARLMRRLRDLLKETRRGFRAVSPAGRLAAVSALAEGADRMFAEAAIGLGYEMDVVLPFKSSDYETTFGDASTTPLYRELLARASRVTELPGGLSDTKSAYEAVGRATADCADILAAVWDGEPPAGRGGTPAIIEYALSKSVPVIWIDARRDRPPSLLRRATDGQSRPVAIGSLAVCAVSLRPHAMVRLSGDIARRALG